MASDASRVPTTRPPPRMSKFTSVFPGYDDKNDMFGYVQDVEDLIDEQLQAKEQLFTSPSTSFAGRSKSRGRRKNEEGRDDDDHEDLDEGYEREMYQTSGNNNADELLRSPGAIPLALNQTDLEGGEGGGGGGRSSRTTTKQSRFVLVPVVKNGASSSSRGTSKVQGGKGGGGNNMLLPKDQIPPSIASHITSLQASHARAEREANQKISQLENLLEASRAKNSRFAKQCETLTALLAEKEREREQSEVGNEKLKKELEAAEKLLTVRNEYIRQFENSFRSTSSSLLLSSSSSSSFAAGGGGVSEVTPTNASTDGTTPFALSSSSSSSTLATSSRPTVEKSAVAGSIPTASSSSAIQPSTLALTIATQKKMAQLQSEVKALRKNLGKHEDQIRACTLANQQQDAFIDILKRSLQLKAHELSKGLLFMQGRGGILPHTTNDCSSCTHGVENTGSRNSNGKGGKSVSWSDTTASFSSSSSSASSSLSSSSPFAAGGQLVSVDALEYCKRCFWGTTKTTGGNGVERQSGPLSTVTLTSHFLLGSGLGQVKLDADDSIKILERKWEESKQALLRQEQEGAQKLAQLLKEQGLEHKQKQKEKEEEIHVLKRDLAKLESARKTGLTELAVTSEEREVVLEYLEKAKEEVEVLQIQVRELSNALREKEEQRVREQTGLRDEWRRQEEVHGAQEKEQALVVNGQRAQIHELSQTQAELLQTIRDFQANTGRVQIAEQAARRLQDTYAAEEGRVAKLQNENRAKDLEIAGLVTELSETRTAHTVQLSEWSEKWEEERERAAKAGAQLRAQELASEETLLLMKQAQTRAGEEARSRTDASLIDQRVSYELKLTRAQQEYKESLVASEERASERYGEVAAQVEELREELRRAGERADLAESEATFKKNEISACKVLLNSHAGEVARLQHQAKNEQQGHQTQIQLLENQIWEVRSVANNLETQKVVLTLKLEHANSRCEELMSAHERDRVRWRAQQQQQGQTAAAGQSQQQQKQGEVATTSTTTNHINTVLPNGSSSSRLSSPARKRGGSSSSSSSAAAALPSSAQTNPDEIAAASKLSAAGILALQKTLNSYSIELQQLRTELSLRHEEVRVLRCESTKTVGVHTALQQEKASLVSQLQRVQREKEEIAVSSQRQLEDQRKDHETHLHTMHQLLELNAKQVSLQQLSSSPSAARNQSGLSWRQQQQENEQRQEEEEEGGVNSHGVFVMRKGLHNNNKDGTHQPHQQPNNNHRNAIFALKIRISELEGELLSLQQAALTETSLQKAAYARVCGQLQQYERAMDEAHTSVARLGEEMQNKVVQDCARNEELVSLSQQLQQTRAELERSRGEVSTLRTVVEESERKKEEYHEKLTASLAQADDLQEELRQTRTDFARKQEQHGVEDAAVRGEWDREVRELKRSLKLQQEAYSLLQVESESRHQHQLDRQQRQDEETSRAFALLEQHTQTVAEEAQSVQLQNQALHEQGHGLQQQVRQLQGKIQEADKGLSEKDARLKLLLSARAQLEEEKLQADNELDSLRDALMSYQEDSQEVIRAHIRAKDDQISNLTASLTAAHEQARSSELKYARLVGSSDDEICQLQHANEKMARQLKRLLEATSEKEAEDRKVAATYAPSTASLSIPLTSSTFSSAAPVAAASSSSDFVLPTHRLPTDRRGSNYATPRRSGGSHPPAAAAAAASFSSSATSFVNSSSSNVVAARLSESQKKDLSASAAYLASLSSSSSSHNKQSSSRIESPSKASSSFPSSSAAAAVPAAASLPSSSAFLMPGAVTPLKASLALLDSQLSSSFATLARRLNRNVTPRKK